MPWRAAPVADKVVTKAHDEFHVRQVKQVPGNVQHFLKRPDPPASAIRHSI